MLERWRPRAWWKLPRGMCRQRAGCNPGAAKADGQAWWKLPRRNWRVLAVLGVLGVFWQTAGSNALTREGYVQAKEREAWQTAGSNGITREGYVQGVLGVWSLANGRLECPNKRELCAGKGQAAMLERWRPRAWWKLPRGMCRQRAGCNPGAAKADG